MEARNKVIGPFYNDWCDSEGYRKQSAAENDIYIRERDKITEIIGEELFERISDNITILVSGVEYAGFKCGFIYGFEFSQGIQEAKEEKKRGAGNVR